MSTTATNQVICGDCLTVMPTMAAGSVALTITSPPYEDARLYKPLAFVLRGQDWVDFMIPRVIEACRVTAGLVLVNAAGKVRDFKYSPVIEWLVADLTRHHGIVCGPAPYVFHRVGIPGSGGPHYHRRDWEPVYAFALPENLPPKWSDNTAMGHPPLWAPGGMMSNRHADGQRKNGSAGPKAHARWGKSINQWGRSAGAKSGNRKSDGSRDAKPRPSHRFTPSQTQRQNGENGNGSYDAPTLANPGNVIKCLVGGGVMGDRLSHDNEAPFPESLVEFFIRSYAPEGGIVMDCFCGSGTVAKVAEKWGRGYIGIDARESQVKLTKRRLREHGQPLFSDPSGQSEER